MKKELDERLVRRFPVLYQIGIRRCPTPACVGASRVTGGSTSYGS